MGLTTESTGQIPENQKNSFFKKEPNSCLIALAGNPNVGKSTIFNALTGLHQHTGNWPGKTVSNAVGSYTYKGKRYLLADIPGTYSLMPHSPEEEIARDFLCREDIDIALVVCDATCLQRNLNLVLQAMEMTDRVMLCVNLMDEAERKEIHVDCALLSEMLGIPVVPTSAGKKDGLSALTECIRKLSEKELTPAPKPLSYRPETESVIKLLSDAVSDTDDGALKRRKALRLLKTNPRSLLTADALSLNRVLSDCGTTLDACRNAMTEDIYAHAESISEKVVKAPPKGYNQKQLTFDRLLTGKAFGIPAMLLLLLFILWLTIFAANYPSELLSKLLFGAEPYIFSGLKAIGLPHFLCCLSVFGIYRVLAWVVSVMLPPMAIFFPLFTLLEDWGFLPRIAFNLDYPFKKCSACGKQALTMCMGFGCNAAGVVGCRIIDSPRERLIAILTNSFVPCNGRFPTLIAMITMFFLTGKGGFFPSLFSALFLTCVILLGVLMTFLSSKLLSKTLLKGIPSSFSLELPPYRRPQIGRVLVRSMLDRTLFVLGRAISVAAPAGLVIYLLANISFGDHSLLTHCASFLDPFGRLIGLDGVLVMSFILGFPANEIVLPIAMMTYLSVGTMTAYESLDALRELLVQNGWTQLTAACTILFSLMHWPCSTTLLTIKKETKSLKWTLAAFLLPTLTGILLCFFLTQAVRLAVLF